MADNLCCACGVLVGIPEWMAGWLPMSPTTLEWANHCRAIIEYRHLSATTEYKLSGVGYREKKSGGFELPTHRDVILHKRKRGRFDRPEMISVSCTCLLDSRCRETPPHCYKFHAHCWSLIERIIGPLAEDRLDLLVTALRARWREQPFEVDKLVERRGRSKSRWVGYHLLSNAMRETEASVLSYNDKVMPLTDPFRVPILQSLIKRSRKRRCCRMKTLRFTRRRIPFTTTSNARANPLGLPLDVQELLLDSLIRLQDMGNAAAAFNWQLPDSYWRYRFPCDVIFELDDIPEEDLDWQYLCIEVGRLMETSRSLQNRQRILRVLRGTRDRFVEIVEQQSCKDAENSSLDGAT